jgi:DNA-binding response OmpR family regulator
VAVPLDSLNDRKLREARPDAVLVELNERGLEVGAALRSSRHRSRSAPIIFLVDEQQARTATLPHPDDDFLIVPYKRAELEARLRLALARAGSAEADEKVLRVAELAVDQDNYEVTLRGEPIDLTYKEYELLRFLVAHSRRVFTRSDLLTRVWGYDYIGGTRTVDVHVRRLRAKLGPRHGSFIRTVRNVGYKFSPQ